MTKQEILKNIKTLPPEEQYDLAMELWESVQIDDTTPLSDEVKQELQRRLAEYEANPDDTLSWEEVRDQVQKEL